MTVKLKTPSNGSVSLTPQDTASDVVLTVPSTAGSFVTANSSGNVGIGTSSINGKLSVDGGVYAAAGSASGVAYGFYPASTYGNTGMFSPAANTVAFATSGGERMRIDSSGNLLVGKTTTNVGTQGIVISTTGIDFARTPVNDVQNFYNASTQALVGQIVVNASSTTYATSSDYRLKDNIQPMQNALATISALKPVTYTWKADGSDGQGFIAHELQAVVPDCVTGEKDAVDAEGKPVYQGVDTSFLVATLTAAIQEQQAIINSLQDRITALENA